MLGAPDFTMEDEEDLAPEKEVTLPLKPQKTLITNFFKTKDTAKPASQKSKDLFGYFKKSRESAEESTATPTIPKSNSLNDSLNDFEEVPKKVKKSANKQKKEVSTPKCESPQKTVSKPKQEKEKKDESMEISYADFLKSQCMDEPAEQNDESVVVVEEDSLMEPDKETEDVEIIEDVEMETESEAVTSNKSPSKSTKDALKSSRCEESTNKVEVRCNSASSNVTEISDLTLSGHDNKECLAETTSKKDDSRTEISTVKKTQESEKDPENKSESLPTGLAQERKEGAENVKKDTEEIPEEKPKPKPKGIGMFFKKVDLNEKWNVWKKHEEEFRTITTKAVVHPEPGVITPGSLVKAKVVNGRRRKSYKSNVAVESDDFDLSITHIESVLIEIPAEEKENKEGPKKNNVDNQNGEEENESWDDEDEEEPHELTENSGEKEENENCGDHSDGEEHVLKENSEEKETNEGHGHNDGEEKQNFLIKNPEENKKNENHDKDGVVKEQHDVVLIENSEEDKSESHEDKEKPSLLKTSEEKKNTEKRDVKNDESIENSENQIKNARSKSTKGGHTEEGGNDKKTRDTDDVVELTDEEVKMLKEKEEKKKEEIRQQNAARIASLDCVKVQCNPKRRQATICFGARGLMTGKALPPVPPKDSEQETAEETTLVVDDNKRGSTPAKSKKRTPRKKSLTLDEEVVITGEESTSSGRKLKASSKCEEKTLGVGDTSDVTPVKGKRSSPRKKSITSQDEVGTVGEEARSYKDKSTSKGKENSTPPKVSQRTPRKKSVTSEEEVVIVDEQKPQLQKISRSAKSKKSVAICKVQSPTEKQLTSTPVQDPKTGGRKSKARTALDSVFKSAIVSTPERTKRPALKLRLRRVKQSSTDDELMSPKDKARQQKVNQAQKILKRAKSQNSKSPPVKSKGKRKGSTNESTKNTKKKSESSDNDTSQPRRSSRSSARVAAMAISTSFEEKKEPKPLKLKQVGTKGKNSKACKKTAKKETKEKTEPQQTKKAASKMASLFSKKKGQSSEKSPIVIEDDDEFPENVVDPEVLKIRKQFLMSGVPETLRKQQAVTTLTGVTYSDYPPLPTVNHTQQRGADLVRDGVDPWNLPKASLNLRKSEAGGCIVLSKPWVPGAFVNIQTPKQDGKREIQKTELAPITEDILPYLLAEVSRYNPVYPVRRVFKQLQKAQKEPKLEDKQDEKQVDKTDKTTDNERQLAKTETTEKPSKGRKRKNPEPEAAAERPTRQSKRQRADPGASRMSLRRKSKMSEEEEVDVVQVDPQPSKEEEVESKPSEEKVKEEQSDLGVKDVLWTEKYEPNSANEVLGNSTSVKKLKTWLVEWKHRTDLELRRARKQILKQAKRSGKSREDIKKEIKKSLGAEWWADDDSDFELDSDDEDSEFEDEDDGRLNNATVLTGPHGVGKTALVYALAKELGYKVFEVNASSRRNGKQMLAKLQEATQSHQVSKKNLDAMFTASMATEALVTKASPKKETKLPTTFANFFTKGKPKEEPSSAPTGGKKRARESKKDNVKSKKLSAPAPETPSKTDASKKGLDLSSTSLVLFEEVDTIFEEDKGFWAAIQTFMSTTKRPIILTASDDKVSHQVDGQHEQLSLRTPPLVNIASHLQLLCLAENLRTSYHDMRSLVEFHRGDLRQCLLNLQFWVQSGGSPSNATREPVKYYSDFFKASQSLANTASGMSQSPLRHLSSATSQDSMSDFETTPQPKRRKRCARLAIEDESSMDSMTNSPRRTPLKVVNEDSQTGMESCMGVGVRSSSELLTAPDTLQYPALTRACLEVLTLAQDLPSGILPHLQERVEHLSTESTDILHQYQAQGFNLLYSNLPSLLGLPCDLPIRRPSAAVLGDQTKVRRRIKCATELFGSDEDSDSDGFVSLKKEGKKPEESVETETPASEPEKKKASVEERILVASMKSLSEMYDTFSYVDAHFESPNEVKEGCCNPSQHSWSAGRVAPGLCDEGIRYSLNDNMDLSHLSEAACLTQLAGVARCRQRVKKCVAHIEQLPLEDREAVKEKLTLPRESPEMRLGSEFSIYQNLESRHRRAYQFVCSVLPHHVQLEKRAVATDYIPSLQTICRSEQLRKSTNTKRRFLHYMDSISLPVTRKQHVMDALCSSFV